MRRINRRNTWASKFSHVNCRFASITTRICAKTEMSVEFHMISLVFGRKFIEYQEFVPNRTGLIILLNIFLSFFKTIEAVMKLLLIDGLYRVGQI